MQRDPDGSLFSWEKTMQIIEKRLEELRPYANNPRKNDEAVEKVAASIKQFGFNVPIMANIATEIYKQWLS